MRFAQPNFVEFSLVVFALVVFYLWAFRRRRRIQERFAQRDLLPQLLSQVNPGRQRLKAALLILGVLLCLVSLMRPQWGFKWQELRRRGLDILIALDTSKSMLASDIKPNRLERAKLAIGDFVKHLKTDRVGLIAFSGSAFLQCPLTIDYGGFLLSLETIDVNTIPRPGTSISSAIKEAMRSFPAKQKKYKVLIIITDGEDHEGDALAVAKKAKGQGIVIFCIGIGTKEGELIFLETEDGKKEFLRDSNGNAVKSRLNEEVLKQVALTTAGAYIRSTSTEFGLERLYKEKISKMEKREFKGKMSKLYEERFQIPLAIGLLLILAEALISERKRHDEKNRLW
jgi:Ca-activated chloride channel family protein